MTNEEAKKILSGYVKACNEDDFPAHEMFEYEEVIEAMTMGAKALSIPSLSSNLDEAAKEYNRNYISFDQCDSRDIIRTFKAGAKWMAGKFQRVTGDLVDWHQTSDGREFCSGIMTCELLEVPEGFYIRKKQ